jgi:serine/threonine protein kinase
MSQATDWFKDDVIVLGTLKQSHQTAKTVPVIPGYDDLHELGRGGQGVVFNALQRSTHRNVAIKVLLDVAWGSETRRRRFEREIELIAALRHPNIVRLYDSGVTDVGYPYYVMEFVDGVGLDKLIGSGVWSFTMSLPPGEDSIPEVPSGGGDFAPVLPLRSALELFAKVCDAVHYAHLHGVIHRDLKPSNIRVDGDGDPHVLDFGLAKAAGGSAIVDCTEMSRTGEFMGSLPWASPEQAEGNPHGTDVRTDVYSLGVLLFQFLTGRFPYPLTGTFREVLDHIQKTPPARPSAYRRDVDDEVETITLKCLAKEPDRRYHTVGELANDIRHYLAGEPIEAKRDSTLYTLKKALRRYRHTARAMSACVLLVLLGAVFLSILWLRALEAEQLSAQQRDAAEIARSSADQAREHAQKEASNARAINQYLIKMLSTPLDRGRDARVADILDGAATQLTQGPALDPLAAATLQQAIGNAYASLGSYEQAEPLLRGALDTYRRQRGDHSAEALDGLASVAWLHRQKGELDEAEALLRKVLDGRRTLFGEDRHETAQSMNDLAYVLEQQGRLDEAERLQRKALAIMRRLLGDEALDTLTSMGHLASVLSTQGRLDEAQALMRERLDTAQRVLGENHRDTVRAMSSYAALLAQTGEYEEAARLSRAVYDANRRMLGDDHPETIVAAANVAITMGTLGQLPEAEPLLRDTLARARRVLGSQHPDTLTVLSSLAAVLMARGGLPEAEGLLREARDVSAELRGADHYDTLYHTNNLAECLQRQGKTDEAVELFRRALAGCRATLGDENPYTLTVMLNLGAALAEAHQFDEADELLHAGLAGRQRLYGDESIETFTARLQVAILSCEQGAYKTAELEFKALLDLAPRVAPPGHWYPAIVQSWYGEALLGQERFEPAETQMLAAYEQLKKIFGDANPRTQKTIRRLVRLYEKWDQPSTAELYRDRLADRGEEK